MQLPDSPYKILALAPFNLVPSSMRPQGPLPVDRQSLDAAMQAMTIGGFLPLDRTLCATGGLDLHFDSIKSLHPDGMLKSVPHLADLLAAREFIIKARQSGEPAARILEQLERRWPDLPALDLKDPVHEAKPARTSSDPLDNLLDMVALPEETKVRQKVAQRETDPLDTMVEKILEAIFQWPAFQQMEAAWRGLRLMLQQGIEGPGIAVEILPVHSEDLQSTLQAITPQLIDHPPSAVLLDVPFDNSPLSMERLAAAAQWAGTLMTPLITWATAGFLQINTWDQFSTLPYLPNHVSQPAYGKYRKLRQSTDGHWLCLACNRFLVRYPYGQDNPPRSVSFCETSLPWISPVWALGTLVAQSISQTGWPTWLTHKQQCQIRDLAVPLEAGVRPAALEADIDRDRRDQLIRAGLTPLVSNKDTAFATQATTVAGTSLAFQLLISRITQFVLWCKDNLPVETDPATLQTQLKLAFQVLSEQSRPPAFESVDISVIRSDEEDRLQVNISVVPDTSLLPSRQPIELQYLS